MKFTGGGGSWFGVAKYYFAIITGRHNSAHYFYTANTFLIINKILHIPLFNGLPIHPFILAGRIC